MDKNILFLYNPNSGNGYIKNHIDYIIKKIQDEGYNLTIYRGNSEGELVRYIKENVRKDKFSRIFISGGDGTLNQCIGSLLDQEIDTPIGILPYGTANDLANGLKIEGDIEQTLKIALGNTYKSIDICKANEHYFINVCAMGMFAGISQKINQKFKKTLGKYAYYTKILESLIEYPQLELKITSEEKILTGKYLLVLVLNGSSVGGFNNIIEQESLEDGKVDILCIKPINLYDIPQLIIDIKNNRYENNKHIEHIKVEEFELISMENKKIYVDIDGETGPELPLSIKVIPKAIKIFANE